MKAKDFNDLKKDDRVVIEPPVIESGEESKDKAVNASDGNSANGNKIDPQHGKIVATFVSRVEKAENEIKHKDVAKRKKAKDGTCKLKAWGFYRDAKTGERKKITEDQKKAIENKIYTHKEIAPYTWAFHEKEFYTRNSWYDDRAIADPPGFMRVEANYSWDQAKEFYVLFKKNEQKPPNKSLSGGMQALLDYRSYITQVLLTSLKDIARERAVLRRQRIIRELSESNRISNPDRADWVPFFELTKAPGGDAPGSKEPTSDIDVNTFNDGTEFLVEDFNDNFARLFDGYEAGIVFDVNIYGKDFLPRLGDDYSIDAEAATRIKKDRPLILPKRDYLFSDQHWERQDAKHQMEAALLKLRRYMKDEEEEAWDSFKEPLKFLDNLKGLDNQYKPSLKKIERKFNANRQLLKVTAEFISTHGVEHHTTVRNEIGKKLAEDTPDDSDDNENPPDANDEPSPDANATMAADNRIYEAKLRQVAQERAMFDVVMFGGKHDHIELEEELDADSAYLKMRTSLSDALYFANEAYVTAGAVTQVVGGKQSLSRGVKSNHYDLTAQANIAYEAHELMHSVIDNLADIYKETIRFYAHNPDKDYAHNPDKDEVDLFGPALLKSSKYIHRLFNAIKHLYRISNRSLPSAPGPQCWGRSSTVPPRVGGVGGRGVHGYLFLLPLCRFSSISGEPRRARRGGCIPVWRTCHEF